MEAVQTNSDGAGLGEDIRVWVDILGHSSLVRFHCIPRIEEANPAGGRCWVGNCWGNLPVQGDNVQVLVVGGRQGLGRVHSRCLGEGDNLQRSNEFKSNVRIKKLTKHVQ